MEKERGMTYVMNTAEPTTITNDEQLLSSSQARNVTVSKERKEQAAKYMDEGSDAISTPPSASAP